MAWRPGTAPRAVPGPGSFSLPGRSGLSGRGIRPYRPGRAGGAGRGWAVRDVGRGRACLCRKGSGIFRVVRSFLPVKSLHYTLKVQMWYKYNEKKHKKQ